MNKKKISIGLLITLTGFPQISETIYTPALPSVASGLMTTANNVELTLSIYFLGFALGVLSWGAASDRLGRRVVMLVGLLIYGIATVGCAMVGSVETLLAWRFFQAFGASVGSVITQAMLRDSYEGAERAKLFSVFSGALAFSPAVGPLFGGFISEFLGWQANFWALAILSLILFLWGFFMLKETRPTHLVILSRRDLRDLIVSMATSPQLWGNILLIAATNGIIFGFYQEAPFVFIGQMGMQPKYYGCFGLLITAATIVAARVSYQKNRYLSANTIIQRGAASVIGGGVALTLVIVTDFFAFQAGEIVALLALFLIFFGIGLIIPNSLSQALKPYQHAAGTAGSFFGGCYYCLVAGSSWLMSNLHNGTSLPLPLYIILLGMVLVMANWMTLLRYPQTLKAKIG